MSELNKLLKVISEVRKLDPEMRVQTLETLLRVAIAGRRGAHMTDIHRGLGMTLAAASRNVSSLSKVNTKGAKAWGLVESHEDPMDRRYKIVALTPKGKQFTDQLNLILGGEK